MVEIGRCKVGLKHTKERRQRARGWNAVAPNWFVNVQTAFSAVLELGYQWPALLVSQWHDCSQGFAPRGGFLAEELEFPPNDGNCCCCSKIF
ncbi:MAG: hypothetical protein N3A53_00475 [Verrucomicrobiae bacterium]|nr:hypothetical protein [Verrucomicrobiae bacterium]